MELDVYSFMTTTPAYAGPAVDRRRVRDVNEGLPGQGVRAHKGVSAGQDAGSSVRVWEARHTQGLNLAASLCEGIGQ